MKKRTILILTITALIAAGGCLIYYFHHQKEVRSRMLEAAVNVNEKAPMMISDDVRIDSATVLPGRVFRYNCAIWQYGKDEISAGTIGRYLLPDIVKDIASDSIFTYLKKNKITLCYSFSDKNGEYIHDFFFSPDDLSEK